MHKTAAFVLTLTACLAQDPAPDRKPASPNKEPELGTVRWSRDLDATLAAAAKSGRPVFLLFQEIPGCDTCTGFGKNVLSHPLLKDAIEAEFEPVVVRNNVDGEEGRIRERYEEPSWNNPVVRFVDAAGKDLLPRKDRIWDAHGIAARMVAALEKAERPVPGYLQIALQESAPKTETAVFEMHCFWEGEAHLGALDGVVRTTSAWRGEAEVVEVTFLPDVISEEALTERAQAKSCKPVARDGLRPAKASDQQHALRSTRFDALDLTPMQRTKVHADLAAKKPGTRWLTPTQLAEFGRKKGVWKLPK